MGFHGQTVIHRPSRHIRTAGAAENGPNGTTRIEVVEEAGVLTVQLGDGPALAAATGIDVVLRPARRRLRCLAGRVRRWLPAYHRALGHAAPARRSPFSISAASPTSPGSARDGELLAFDTGPGNAMIDDWMQTPLRASRDEDGAAGGQRPRARGLRRSLSASIPISASPRRNRSTATRSRWNCSTTCRPRTAPPRLTAFTAASIARRARAFSRATALWMVSGGGRRNRTLMAMIAGHVEAAVAPAEAVGMDGDGLEAEAWAYLAVRSLKGLAITFPGTTGVCARSRRELARAPK